MAIKWKEKYDAVVVDCHHSLCLCDNRMRKSLPKIFFLFFNFFRETPTSPWVPFRAKFWPLWWPFSPSRPLALSPWKISAVYKYKQAIAQHAKGKNLYLLRQLQIVWIHTRLNIMSDLNEGMQWLRGLSRRGSRKFCQMGSKFDNFFFSLWGDRGSKYRFNWAIICPPAKHHL